MVVRIIAVIPGVTVWEQPKWALVFLQTATRLGSLVGFGSKSSGSTTGKANKKKKGNAQSDAFTKGGSFAGSTDALPPPSPSVSATSAKTKGIDSQKQGQYDDAIKWLSC